uniref:Large ribosomal subunit protein bL12c n=1 Tax=Pedobesia claviformis TaxID=2364088 RepID=A0A386B0T7_9CHLO|nr:ribosomal protein L12 [Pedobesia claviformis]AYC65311.1 ribosomal protein L12 [Pedobesia claviformis]
MINQLKKITLLEAVELVNQMQTTFGININQLTATSSIPSQDNNIIQSNTEINQTEFNVLLEAIPTDDQKAKRLSTFRLIRELTSVGLKEAKEMTSNLPTILKESISKEQAEKIKLQFEEIGAKIKII